MQSFATRRNTMALSLLVVLGGCAFTRPSELDYGPNFLVVVKSVQLPESKPILANRAHHTFFDLKFGSEDRWSRCETDTSGPEFFEITPEEARSDKRYGGRDTHVLEVFQGDVARRIIAQIPAAVARYEEEYRSWPGPNSNTFADYLSHEIPELDFDHHHNAIGKDYASFVRVGGTSTGTGVELETPVLGFQLGFHEGVELHFLQLTFGVSLFPPAIKFPFLPRLGFPIGPSRSALADPEASSYVEE